MEQGIQFGLLCPSCSKNQPYKTSAWFNHVWDLHVLKEGGYPFGQEDLSLEEWRGLAELKTAIATPTMTE